MINNTVGTTEITPVETEVTKSMKQESRDFSRGRFKFGRNFTKKRRFRELFQNRGSEKPINRALLRAAKIRYGE